MKGWFANIGWILVGLLVLASGMISAGHREYLTNPSSDSFFPSGASALKQLLVNRGYAVRVDRTPTPVVGSNEIALEFFFPEDEAGGPDTAKAIEKIRESTSKGATTVLLPLSQAFAFGPGAEVSDLVVNRPDGAPRSVTGNRDFDSPGEDYDSSVSRPLFSGKQSNFITLHARGKGVFVTYASGIGLTNRYIDKLDNAQVLLETLAAVAPPHAQIVLPEATFGNVRSSGFLETIGSWAESVWYQLLFLFAVVVYTLNKRFGLPEEYRPLQRGTRELLDAVTDTYARSCACEAALQAAVQISDTRLRIALKLPRDASARERDRLLPDSLAQSLATAQAAALIKGTREKQAFQIAQKLESDVNAFLAQRSESVPTRSRRRRVA